VLLLAAAPVEWRGGDARHARKLRCMHDAPPDVLTDAYPAEEFWQDLLTVTGGQTDEARGYRPALATINGSVPWIVFAAGTPYTICMRKADTVSVLASSRE